MRLPGGQRNFLTFVLVAVGAFVVTLYIAPSKGDEAGDLVIAPSSEPVPATGNAGELEGSSPSDISDASGPVTGPTEPVDTDLRAYAIPLVELQGLAPDVTAGTRVELWVAWDPPVTERVRVQKLFGGAQVGRVIPPTAAEAPTTIELLVPVREFPELLFADRHGALSAAVLP